MNKSLLLLAAAAMTLAACSNSDELTGNANGTDVSSEPTAVQFSTYLAGGQTRASGGTVGAQTTTTLQAQGFGVFAYKTDDKAWANATDATPDFMYNQKVEYKNNVWEYTPIKYWPNDFSAGNVDDKQGTNGEDYNATGSEAGSKISFFAYAPYVDAMDYTSKSSSLKHGSDDAIEASDGTNATDAGILGMTFNTTKGAPYIKYQLASTDIAKAVDLLWGQKLKSTYALADGKTQTLTTDYNVDLTKQAVNEKIGFSFKHALAKLGGNTSNKTNTTVSGEDNGKVKIILDIDNGKWDASTAITGGSKDDATLVTVKEITIQDLKSWKDANPSSTNYTTVTTENKYRKRGWFNLATGEWDAPATDNSDYATETEINKYSTTIKYNGDGTATDKLKMNSDIAEPETAPTASNGAWATGTIKGVTTTAKSVYAAAASDNDNLDPGVLMIPSSGAEQPFVVTVDYFVRTADSHLNKGYSEAEQKITNLVNIPAGALEPNKVYTLLIHLGLTSVKFEAVVADWDNADGTSTSGTSTDEGNKGKGNQKDIYLPSNTLSKTTYSAETVNVAATATEASISLTGLSDDASKVTFKSGDTGLSATEATVSSKAATVTISGLTENTTGSAKTYKAVLQVKKSDDTVLQEIEVTIVQAAATTKTQTAA